MNSKLIITFLSLSSVLLAESKISANIATINGKAGEYVYDTENGQQISYLDWKIKNVPILKLSYDYSINNWEFSIDGKKSLNKNFRSGTMKDYDWFLTPETGEPEERGQSILSSISYPKGSERSECIP